MDAKGGLAIHEFDAHLYFRDLSVEVSRHEALPQQFNSVQLGLDAATAVVSAPVSPDCTVEVFRGSQGLVSGHATRGDGLPRLGDFAGCDDSMGTATGSVNVKLRPDQASPTSAQIAPLQGPFGFKSPCSPRPRHDVPGMI